MKETIDSFDKMKEEYIKTQDERIKSLKKINTAHEMAIASYEKVVASQRETIEHMQEEVKCQDDVINHFRQRMHMLEHELSQKSQQTSEVVR